MVMQLVAVAAFMTIMLTVFSIKANFHIQEGLLTDASLPLLQSVTYSSVDLATECKGATNCEAIRVYDLLALSAASSNAEVTVCGGTCNVTQIVETRMDYYQADLGYFGVSLKNSTRDVIFESGNTPHILGEAGKEITEVKATEYLIPLPLNGNNPEVAYCLLTKVKTV